MEKQKCKGRSTESWWLNNFFRDPETGLAFFKEWESRKMQARKACPTCNNDEIVLKAATISGGRQLTESEKLERAKKLEEAIAKNGFMRRYLYRDEADKRRYIEMTEICHDTHYKGLVAERILEYGRSSGQGRKTDV